MSFNPVISRTFEFFEPIVTQIQLPGKNPTALITESEFGAIKNLTGYLDREGFFGMIATVLHRIWNACKAVFGKSDWQQAERAAYSIIDRVRPFAKVLGKELELDFIKANIGEGYKWALDEINALNKGDPKNPQIQLFFANSTDQALTDLFKTINRDAVIKNFFREVPKLGAQYQRLQKSKDTEQEKKDLFFEAFQQTGFTTSYGVNHIKHMVNLYKVYRGSI